MSVILFLCSWEYEVNLMSFRFEDEIARPIPFFTFNREDAVPTHPTDLNCLDWQRG
jgi:hypothetical protein